MRRLLVSLVTILVVAIAAPAHAGSAWDPDDVGGGLDLRWVGVHTTGDGHVRIAITLWDAPGPDLLGGARSGVFVRMLGDHHFEALIRPKPSGAYRVIITNRTGHEVYRGPARHPDAHTLRFVVPRLGCRRFIAMSEYSVEGVGFVDRAPDEGSVRP